METRENILEKAINYIRLNLGVLEIALQSPEILCKKGDKSRVKISRKLANRLRKMISLLKEGKVTEDMLAFLNSACEGHIDSAFSNDPEGKAQERSVNLMKLIAQLEQLPKSSA